MPHRGQSRFPELAKVHKPCLVPEIALAGLKTAPFHVSSPYRYQPVAVNPAIAAGRVTPSRNIPVFQGFFGKDEQAATLLKSHPAPFFAGPGHSLASFFSIQRPCNGRTIFFSHPFSPSLCSHKVTIPRGVLLPDGNTTTGNSLPQRNSAGAAPPMNHLSPKEKNTASRGNSAVTPLPPSMLTDRHLFRCPQCRPWHGCCFYFFLFLHSGISRKTNTRCNGVI